MEYAEEQLHHVQDQLQNLTNAIQAQHAELSKLYVRLLHHRHHEITERLDLARLLYEDGA
jgi:hypothetical protein